MNVDPTNTRTTATSLPQPRGEEGLSIAINMLNKWVNTARHLGINIDEQIDKLFQVITDAPTLPENPKPVRNTLEVRCKDDTFRSREFLIYPQELLATQQMAHYILYCNQIIRKIAFEQITKRKDAELEVAQSELLKKSITNCAENAIKELSPERSLISPKLTGIQCITAWANFEMAVKFSHLFCSITEGARIAQ